MRYFEYQKKKCFVTLPFKGSKKKELQTGQGKGKRITRSDDIESKQSMWQQTAVYHTSSQLLRTDCGNF
jgi:hypothetical protein